jgi:protein-disulfide isomerase
MKGTVLLAMLASVTALTAQRPLVEGNANSSVRVVVFEDLQCPDCAAFRRMIDEKLLPKYGATVAFEHRDFPLAKHAWSRKAAIAARFFQEEAGPEAGLAYRRHTLATLRETTVDNFNERLAAFAREHKVDPQKAVQALDDPKYAAMVEQDFQDGVARGVAKTPTAFVNGAPFIERFTFEEISKEIDRALAEAK